jgi:hypothetical protein
LPFGPLATSSRSTAPATGRSRWPAGFGHDGRHVAPIVQRQGRLREPTA